jgi:uncharacterized membrane protein
VEKVRGRRALQVVTAILAVIPVVTGLIGLSGLHDPLYSRSGVIQDVLLDSNLRFFSGAWLGLGLGLFWLIPRIEKQTVLFRAIWSAIFLGGIGRCLSMFLFAVPPTPFIAFTILEVIGAPVFIGWQRQVTNAARKPRYQNGVLE